MTLYDSVKGAPWRFVDDPDDPGLAFSFPSGSPITLADDEYLLLVKDEEALLAFYDFPAEHWKHIRTTNPIESTFATVRLRTAKTRGCLSRTTALTMVFQLCRCAQKRWRKLSGYVLLGKVIEGIVFIDGVEDVAA